MSEVEAGQAPAEPSDAELTATLSRHLSGAQAMSAALSAAGKTLGIGLPVALAYGLVSGGVGYGLLTLGVAALDADPATLDTAAQILLACGAFASLYGIIQFTKRATASRTSWAPALFALPLLMAGGAFTILASTQSSQMRPFAVQLLVMAWSLVWMSFGGAAAAIAWVISGKGAFDGRAAGADEVLREVQSRTIEIAGPHGARVQAVSLGMQIVLPGVFYALQLAFTDMIAVLDRDKHALVRSGLLTTGMRGRLFRLMFGWWIAGMVLTLGATFAIEVVTPAPSFEQLDTNRDGQLTADEAAAAPAIQRDLRPFDADKDGQLSPAEFEKRTADDSNDVTTFEGFTTRLGELVLDPTSITLGQHLASELLWGLLTWLLTLALLAMYLERERQVAAKRELKRRETARASAG